MKTDREHGLLILMLVSLTAVSGAGCASQRYVHETTQITVGHIDNLRGDYGRYVQQAVDDGVARIDRVAQQRQRLARAEQSLEAQVERGDGKVSYGPLYQDLVAEAAQRIKAERAVAGRAVAERAALLEKQKPVEKESLRKLQELSKQLQELAKPAHLTGEVKFLSEYFEAVGKAVKDLDAKSGLAKKKADEAGAKPVE